MRIFTRVRIGLWLKYGPVPLKPPQWLNKICTKRLHGHLQSITKILIAINNFPSRWHSSNPSILGLFCGGFGAAAFIRALITNWILPLPIKSKLHCSGGIKWTITQLTIIKMWRRELKRRERRWWKGKKSSIYSPSVRTDKHTEAEIKV